MRQISPWHLFKLMTERAVSRTNAYFLSLNAQGPSNIENNYFGLKHLKLFQKEKVESKEEVVQPIYH
jgi:hypothetical protein